MAWLDAHCHLVDEAFREDFSEVLKRIEDVGLRHVMLICLNKNEFEQGLKLREKYPFIDLAVGIHPEDTNRYNEVLPLGTLEEYLVKYPFIKAVGEIGLDYHYTQDNKEAQKELFIKQIELAKKYHKPIEVHSRDAIQDTYDILKQYHHEGVIHCFSGSKEMAKEFVKLGYYISFGGVLTFKSAKEIKEVALVTPLDKMLIETDCPYLTPEPLRGKRNEPSYVVHTGKYLCSLLNQDETNFQEILNNNYERLFKI